MFKINYKALPAHRHICALITQTFNTEEVGTFKPQYVHYALLMIDWFLSQSDDAQNLILSKRSFDIKLSDLIQCYQSEAVAEDYKEKIVCYFEILSELGFDPSQPEQAMIVQKKHHYFSVFVEKLDNRLNILIDNLPVLREEIKIVSERDCFKSQIDQFAIMKDAKTVSKI